MEELEKTAVESAEPAEPEQAAETSAGPEQIAEISAEAETAADAPLKKSRRFRWVMAGVTLVFVCLAAAAWVILGKLRDKRAECLETRLPSGLSAVDTVKKYFEYWDDGNNEGMKQAAVADVNTTLGDSDSFDPGLCYFCDIELERAEQLENIVAEGFEGCAESAVVSVDFTYRTSFGFGDVNMPENNKGWEFYLARLEAEDDFKIIAVEKAKDKAGEKL